MGSGPTWLRVERSGGRVVEAVVTGPVGAPLLVWHVGTPMAAVPFPALDEIAGRRDLRVVTYSRPGYAGSSRLPGRSVADAADDTAAVVSALDAESFLTIGWSGGGPHALACAALVPDRCRAAASVGGVAPYDAVGLDWFGGMAEENVEEFSAALGGAERLAHTLDDAANSLSEVDAAGLADSLGGLASDVDKAALVGDFATYVAASFARAGTSGSAGWCDDDLAFVQDWGFDIGGGDVPVLIWHGQQDRFVPSTHGQWLAEHIPHANARLPERDGHLTLVANRLEEIVDDLITLAVPR